MWGPNIMSIEALDKLFILFRKYVHSSKPNVESQMCLLWSIKNPPDVLEDTKQLKDIKTAFDVSITEDQAVEMYDMNLLEASEYVQSLIEASMEMQTRL